MRFPHTQNTGCMLPPSETPITNKTGTLRLRKYIAMLMVPPQFHLTQIFDSKLLSKRRWIFIGNNKAIYLLCGFHDSAEENRADGVGPNSAICSTTPWKEKGPME
jgi:hypothetical protein